MNVILAVLFLSGVCVGGLLNLGVYRLAWHARSISPWSAPPAEAPRRHWYDRIPILGWLGLSRESGLHGRGFWVRPMLVELLCGIGFAALYWWEISQAGLLPAGWPKPVPAGMLAVLHVQYGCHLVLISLMLVASLIDADEKTIPDAITVPGTLFGLVAAASYPWSLLPELVAGPTGGVRLSFLRLTSPNPWPDWLGGFPQAWALAIGLCCWWGWCFALTHRTWYARHGWARALRLSLARLFRERSTWRILLTGVVGSAVLGGVWFVGGPHWEGLLTSLVGLAACGGIIWAIRIIGSAVLRREAMGFGDVTLMAMIGAFLGWQTFPLVLFGAALTGLVVGVIGLVLRHGPEIPYGPFLCLAALGVLVRWASLWEWIAPVYGLGWFLVLLIAMCLILMVPLLVVIRLIRQVFEH
ncbi:MAG TPA: prepilin peptidase [Thermoguttaceae bacterium]|nr:prepilin peptidase [Thermoguttaceae bacterium]